MARIRTVKPDFFTDEKLAECSRDARFLFIGLIIHADDEGRMAYSAKRISMQVFPGDQVDVAPWVAELAALGIVRLYEIDGHHYLAIPNFTRHQKVHNPTKSRYPEPRNVPRGTPENSGALPKNQECSVISPTPRVGTGTGTGRELELDKNKNKVKSVRAQFKKPSQGEVEQFASVAGLQIDAAHFIDHFESNGWLIGGKAPMKNWKAAARNWVRRGFTKPAIWRNGDGAPNKTQQRLESVNRGRAAIIAGLGLSRDAGSVEPTVQDGTAASGGPPLAKLLPRGTP